jgi:hypothetical protein
VWCCGYRAGARWSRGWLGDEGGVCGVVVTELVFGGPGDGGVTRVVCVVLWLPSWCSVVPGMVVRSGLCGCGCRLRERDCSEAGGIA